MLNVAVMTHHAADVLPVGATRMSSEPTATHTWIDQIKNKDNLTSAAKWGVMVAGAYLLVTLGLTVLSNLLYNGQNVTQNPIEIVPLCLGFFALAFAIYGAAFLSSSERGNITTGLLGSIIMLVLISIINQIFGHTTASANNGGVGSALLGIVLDLALALLIGWTGAFYGVKGRTKATPKAKPSM